MYRVAILEGSSEFTTRIVEVTFDPALAVRRNLCSNETGGACNDDVEGPEAFLPEVRHEEPPRDRYHVVVDGQAGWAPFTLELQVR